MEEGEGLVSRLRSRERRPAGRPVPARAAVVAQRAPPPPAPARSARVRMRCMQSVCGACFIKTLDFTFNFNLWCHGHHIYRYFSDRFDPQATYQLLSCRQFQVNESNEDASSVLDINAEDGLRAENYEK